MTLGDSGSEEPVEPLDPFEPAPWPNGRTAGSAPSAPDGITASAGSGSAGSAGSGAVATLEPAVAPEGAEAVELPAPEDVDRAGAPLDAVGVPVEFGPEAPAPKRRRRLRIPHPPLQSPLGLLIVFILIAGFGSVITVGSVVAVNWTETPDFCGRCHTMEPEMKAFVQGAHKDLTCAECHVKPGIAGWVEAKIKGTKQLFEILTNTYPVPILPPAHEGLPAVTDTCLHCHNITSLAAAGGPVKLVMLNKYALDATNTESKVALVLRPQGIGFAEKTKGVHWHTTQDVEYLRADEQASKIDWVKVTWDDGTADEFISLAAVKMTDNVGPDIAALQSTEAQHRMDCLDCHNRVGHGAPTVAGAIDSAIDNGAISQALPYIKREGTTAVSGTYPDEAAAAKAIADIRSFYATKYPLISATDGSAIDSAVAQLQSIYSLIATPAMEVSAATYPNNLGHQNGLGCFRCHDGAHYKVENGALANETIPSTCQTCHTFPQIGTTNSAVLIGDRPTSHDDRLWVFSHKSVATSASPEGTACGACHTRTYCQNCHATKAVQVPHENMTFDHAAVARKVGGDACTICHQAPFCAQCHGDQVLPSQAPDQITPIGPTGLVAPGGHGAPAARVDRIAATATAASAPPDLAPAASPDPALEIRRW